MKKITNHPFFWVAILTVVIILLLLLAYLKDELKADGSALVIIATCLIAVPLSVLGLLILIDSLATKMKNRSMKK